MNREAEVLTYLVFLFTSHTNAYIVGFAEIVIFSSFHRFRVYFAKSGMYVQYCRIQMLLITGM